MRASLGQNKRSEFYRHPAKICIPKHAYVIIRNRDSGHISFIIIDTSPEVHCSDIQLHFSLIHCIRRTLPTIPPRAKKTTGSEKSNCNCSWDPTFILYSYIIVTAIILLVLWILYPYPYHPISSFLSCEGHHLDPKHRRAVVRSKKSLSNEKNLSNGLPPVSIQPYLLHPIPSHPISPTHTYTYVHTVVTSAL
jgi:hypothetical protein